MSIIYSTDLTNKQWDIIKPLLPAPKKRGHPRVVDLRRIINGILYINRTGCQWRMLPKEFLPWQTTYGYFRQFRINGTWDLIHDTLREKVRQEAQKEKIVSFVIRIIHERFDMSDIFTSRPKFQCTFLSSWYGI